MHYQRKYQSEIITEPKKEKPPPQPSTPHLLKSLRVRTDGSETPRKLVCQRKLAFAMCQKSYQALKVNMVLFQRHQELKLFPFRHACFSIRKFPPHVALSPFCPPLSALHPFCVCVGLPLLPETPPSPVAVKLFLKKVIWQMTLSVYV